MTAGLLGKKIGMTQIFKEDGTAVPVTVIQAGPCAVTQKKTMARDGYAAIQLGFDDRPERVINKAERGHFSKAKSAPKRFLKEVRLTPEVVDSIELGQTIGVGIFKPGIIVDVSGISKGKGFQGVMRRHNFDGAPGSHGTHEFFRHGGSIGNRQTPGKTFKNKKMPGHQGDELVTIQNLVVEEVDEKNNLLLIRGAVPGCKNSYLFIHEGSKVAPEKRQVKFSANKSDAPEEEKKSIGE